MPRLLYIWEYGSDLGHINSFLPIAKKLKELHWELIFAIPEHVAGIAAAKIQIQRLGAQCISTPGSSIIGSDSLKSSCHVDMLRQLTGLRDEQEFGFYLDSWLSTLKREKPDLVLCDYSIIGLIAANSLSIPSVVLDQGWFVPDLNATQAKQPFHKLLSGAASVENHIDDPDIVQKENELLEIINRQLSARNLTNLKHFIDIYRCDELILNNFPELSSLEHQKVNNFIGSFKQESHNSSVEWPNPELSKPNIFVYLKRNTPVLEYVLSSLASNESYNVIAYIPGVNPAFIKRYQRDHMVFSSTAVNLPELLDTTNLVISNAGVGLINQSLLAGIPLIMLPQWTEQQFNAKRVQQLYAGEVITYYYSEKEVAATIERVLGNQIYLAKAREFKLNHKPAEITEVVSKITSLVPSTLENSKESLNASNNFVSLSELDWFYLIDTDIADDDTWQQIQQFVPHAKAIFYKDFWSGIDNAAKQASTERFITIKQGCKLDPYLFIAEAEYPTGQQHAHWYWNKLDKFTGLVFGSSDVTCWNTRAAKEQTFANLGYSNNPVEMHTFLRRPEFSPFAKVLSQSSQVSNAEAAFYQGYRTTLKMIDAFSGDIARIIQYPSSMLVRRLFIHMSAEYSSQNPAYYAIGARLAFVNQFIRFKKGFDLITPATTEQFISDAVEYAKLKLDSPLQLNQEQLIELSTYLGDKIRAAHQRPPLLDMDQDSASNFKKTLMANRADDHHLFSPSSITAAL
ncbi:glycosyltransferase [Agarivorans aestuarii]|uniref:Glycosyltransferase n=1 Tax=Agarivorans aestuarii TaxID=1563703 RepID=A0ABU7G9K9_9ALTE|nr:glycosyltransferase [Agarivorans aestuarii]MEE1676083.1 glycosyltransferase [Agarivorans aestuarii]